MRVKKSSSTDYVHKFTEMAYMKFRPTFQNIKQQTNEKEDSVIMSRIKSFIKWKAPSSTDQSRVSNRSTLSKNSSQASIRSAIQPNRPGTKLRFLQKISPEHYLIGNQNQLDLIFIGGVVGSFIDTDFMWSLNIKKPIRNIAIDTKKGYIAIQSNLELIVYKYENKKLKEFPKLINSIKIKNETEFLLFPKDSVLTAFYGNFMDVFIIQQTGIKRKACKQIKGAAQLSLFQIPSAIQNQINVFYTKKNLTSKTFALWCVQIIFKSDQFDVKQPMKIYDIGDDLRNKMKLENYSKQVFLMNLGFQILAVKKGYVIDSAFLNIKQHSTLFQYVGNNRLLHLTPQKAEIYKFAINLALNPPRIQITSLDSIQIKQPVDYQFVGALQMLNKNYAVFYQIRPHHNMKLKGQITYSLAITKHVTIQEKINQIFAIPPGKLLKNMDYQLIQEKVDMARKIGLTRTQIYLELWNRTNKSEVQEFKFLLDTLDYETIRKQIQKKLQKASMMFRQVYKIQQSCFDMLRDLLFSQNCTEHIIRNYLTSHFWLRKLQLYRDMLIYQKKKKQLKIGAAEKKAQENGDALKIGIQKYNQYMKADIKNFFLILVNQYCNQDKDVLTQMRIFLRAFRFTFRIIYKDLLGDIIKTAKGNLVKMIQNFTEILPYRHLLSITDDKSLYEGVWEQISQNQWDKNLHIQGMSTIDNRELISEIPKTLWYRRFFLTQHDMISKSKQQILKIHQSNKSQQIFYYFISKVFEQVKEEESLSFIIPEIQRKYDQMPQHLNQKIFLYRQIYNFFQTESKVNSKFKNFYEILKMKDYELFDQFFNFQKIKKGCFLRDIKGIYEKIGGTTQTYYIQCKHLVNKQSILTKQKIIGRGLGWFNEGMLSYFASDLSEVSDLKYILNRINNEKRQFFQQNQSLIAVLIEATQMKLRIGGQKDIPIAQVLAYLQNIPVVPGHPMLQELKQINKISEEADRFKQIKLNMTILQITKNCQKVISSLIDFQIEKRQIMQIQDIDEMIESSYDILAQIQIVKQKIYKNQYSDLAFFLYLTKIMEDIRMIPYAAQLIQNQYLGKYFSVDMKVVEDLILFMYKFKLSKNPKYVQNQEYLRQLLQILPQDSECRIYIQCQLAYAKLLSSSDNFVEYPLTDKTDGISIAQLQQRVQQLSCQFLLTVDLKRLHLIMNQMQEICYEQFDENYYTTINQVFEVVIIKFIQGGKIKESIPYIHQLISFQKHNQFAIVFPLYLVQTLCLELAQQNKNNFLKTVSFLFNQPLQLLKIIEELIQKTFTPQQQKQFFIKTLKENSDMKRNYNKNNKIMDPIYLELIRNQEMQSNFIKMVDQTIHHLVHLKEEFNKIQYYIMGIILVQQPYALTKYIFSKRYTLNFKLIRSFLSYVIKQEIFDALKVLEYGRRVFNIVLQTSCSIFSLESIFSQYQAASMDTHVQFQDLQIKIDITDEDQISKKYKNLQTKLQKCISAFDRKKNSVTEDLKIKQIKQNLEKKRQRIQKQLVNPIDLSQKAPSQYPFGDSDDDYQNDQKPEQFSKSPRRKKKQQFDPSLQRNLLVSRTNKNYALFLSTKGEADHLIKSSLGKKSKLKPSQSLGFDATTSVRFTQGFGLKKQSRFKQDSQRLGPQNMRYSQQEGNSPFFGNKSEFKNRGRKGSGGFQADIGRIRLQEQEDYPMVNVSSQQSEGGVIQDINIKQTSQKIIEQGQKNELENKQNDDVLLQKSFHIVVSTIDQNAFMSIKDIKKLIYESVQLGESSFNVNLGQLSFQEDKENQNFQNYLIQLIKSIYEDSNHPLKTNLMIIKQILGLYPELEISRQFLEIYFKFQSFCTKYDTNISIIQMFPIEGMFTKSTSKRDLFNFVCPKITNLVDSSNLPKISKIIKLVFNQSSFEYQIVFAYLCAATQRLDRCQNSSGQFDMQMQEFSVLLQKIPLNTITSEGYQLIKSMKNKQSKNKVIEACYDYIKGKKGETVAVKFKTELLKRV